MAWVYLISVVIRLLSYCWFSLVVAYDHWPMIQHMIHGPQCKVLSITDNTMYALSLTIQSVADDALSGPMQLYHLVVFSRIFCCLLLFIMLCAIRG